MTIAYLEREGVAPAAHQKDGSPGKSAASDVQRLRARLETLAVDYAEGLLTREQVHAATATLRAKIEQADRVLTASTKTRSLSVVDDVADLREAWQGFGLDTRRAVLRALWRVELTPQPTERSGVHPDGVKVIPQPGGAA